MTTPPDLKTLCAAATQASVSTSSLFDPPASDDKRIVTHVMVSSNSQAHAIAYQKLIARLSPEVVLRTYQFIRMTPPAHPINANDAGAPCACSQCQRWCESRDLIALLDSQPEARK